MIRLIIFFYGLSLFQFLSAQELICPPDVTRICHENLNDVPQIINGAGLNLQSSREFTGDNCQLRNVINTFSLVDLSKDSTVASCQQIVTVQPFREVVRFPRDTLVAGYTRSQVEDIPIFTAGLFPQSTECNINFTFNDVAVQSFPELFVFRDWEAENLCTGEIIRARQQIVLYDLPNSSIATQVEDCSGFEIGVDSIEIYFQGELVDRSSCFVPFFALHEVLNCIASNLLVEDDDNLRLNLIDLENPFLGVSSIDLVDIQRHILGLQRFDSECRLRAADVNRDGRINGTDLVEARRLILGIYTEWPFGDGPDYFINGELRDELVLRKSDFPLSSLDIVLANQGNVSTN